ncbi:MAG TPA: methyltransferase domain-containing protein [Thermoanaerobaculia bacterium]|nr:methyltransferase domain-containing protein [Thermoanaerobaculia bacterium]
MRRAFDRFPPSILGGVFAAVSLLVLSAAAAGAQPPQPRDEFRGRPIAEVMSYRGAPWLERDDRDQEENTSLLIELLSIEPGDRVADLGCGSGYFARRMAPKVGSEGHILCIDIQPEMLEIATRLAEEEGIGNIEMVLSEPDDPKIPAGSVDLILLVDVYHELADPEAMLARMREALAPGGRVALVEYRLEDDSGAHIKLEHRMSVEQVREEWEPAGFELVELIEELPTQHLFLFARAQ